MPSHLCLLQGSRHLTDLNIVLLEAEFPVDFRRWRKLCTLRVEFCAKIGDFLYDHPVSFPSYAHLTTLAVDDHVGSEWLDDHLRRAHFPSLRVLNLQNATSPPWLVYQFVHRHPTLLEVNVSFDEDLDCWLAFDRLLKLINGTGTWGPEDSESKVDDPNFTIQGIPSLAEEKYCVPTRFAFSRVPLYPEATLADQPEGPQRERYTATGLALHIVDQCFWEDYGPEVVRLHQFLERMPRVFPQLAELRLAYDTPYIDDSFQRIMQSCAESLSSWSSLRRLTFSWGRLADDEADPSTDFSWHPSQAPEYLGYVLDGIHPPIYIPREMFETRPELMEELPPTGEPYTFDQLEMVFGLHPREAEIMKRIIRAECDQDMDDDTLMHTPGLPLQAWVARHEPFVLKMMRQLAVNCPTLESIAWYPIGQAIWCWPARWLWRVHREKESHSVRMLTNEFTYRGCSKGDPPEFHILVGQELAVAEEHPAMVRRKDRL
ncbi:hypothetical protein EVJ58_g102 [Rhodofomes roseus]|uniref:Uncharacterized protein n=1 Tax=Rhodofomes roseus TaxID=34475 RepID=A0A4Y9Z9B4_9APHY|nr:hypothetical protein EVJ58_g102 [Rhodofomes roseus]